MVPPFPQQNFFLTAPLIILAGAYRGRSGRGPARSRSIASGQRGRRAACVHAAGGPCGTVRDGRCCMARVGAQPRPGRDGSDREVVVHGLITLGAAVFRENGGVRGADRGAGRRGIDNHARSTHGGKRASAGSGGGTLSFYVGLARRNDRWQDGFRRLLGRGWLGKRQHGQGN